MKQEVIRFGKKKNLAGILTNKEEESQSSKIGVVFINAGLIHKVGPNRLYVYISRKLSRIGISSLRFDYSGQGDSIKSNNGKSYQETIIIEIAEAIDIMQKKTGLNKFVLIGICTGAEEAFMFSQIDDRIIGLIPIDGIFQDKELVFQGMYFQAERKCQLRYYKKHILSLSRWRKLLAGKSNVISKQNFQSGMDILARYIKSKFKCSNKEIQTKDQVRNMEYEKLFSIDDWESLFKRNVYIYVIFCEGNPSIDLFNMTIAKNLKNKKRDNILNVELIKNVDHTFTPVWSQYLLSEKITHWFSSIDIAN